jgi:hypothetical protein
MIFFLVILKDYSLFKTKELKVFTCTQSQENVKPTTSTCSCLVLVFRSTTAVRTHHWLLGSIWDNRAEYKWPHTAPPVLHVAPIQQCLGSCFPWWMLKRQCLHPHMGYIRVALSYKFQQGHRLMAFRNLIWSRLEACVIQKDSRPFYD